MQAAPSGIALTMAKQFQFFGLGLFYWGRLYGLISNF